MKIRRVLFFIIASLCIVSTYAQQTTTVSTQTDSTTLNRSLSSLHRFDLDSYHPPKYVYQYMDFKFDFSGLYNNTTKGVDELATDQDREDYDKSSATNLNISGNYFRRANSEKYQGSFNINLSSHYRFIKEKNESIDRHVFFNNNTSENQFASAPLTATSENRFYLTPRFFVEVSPALSVSPQWTKEKYYSEAYSNPDAQENTASTESGGTKKLYDLDFNLPVSVGWGRIDEVSDARLAVYILEDWAKQGVLSRAVTSNDVIALASQITKIKNKRVFDSRRKKIAEITTIDSMAQAIGLAGEKSNAAYFTTLNDNWDYSQTFSRWAGWRFYTGIEAEIKYDLTKFSSYATEDNNSSPESQSSENSIQYRGLAQIGFRHEKPFNLYWQGSGYAKMAGGLFYYKEKRDSVLEYEDRNVPAILAEVGYAIGYYPSSRTYLNIGTAWNLSYSDFTRHYLTGSRLDYKYKFNAAADLQINLYYYISPQIRLSVNYELSFAYGYNKFLNTAINNSIEAWMSVDKNVHCANNLTISLLYSLF